jgi:hypothetical protein
MKEKIAAMVNDMYGGQEWINKFWITPKGRQIMHWLILAPDWTLSTIRIATDPIKNIKDPLKRHFMGRFWRNMILTAIVTLQAANFALNGKWTWQNEEGHEWDIDVTNIIRALPWNNQDEKQRYYANPFKQLKEIIGWIEDPIRTIGAKSSPAVHLIFEQMSGHQIGSGWDMPWDTKELSFYESMPDRILSVMDKFVPFSFSGSNFAFAFPMSKGMTKYKAVKAYEDMIKAQVDPTLYQKIMPHEEYLQLRNKLDKACQLNGVDGSSMFDQAMNTVRGEYYSAMWKAIDKKNFKEAERWAEKLLKIGANVEGITESGKRRGKSAVSIKEAELMAKRLGTPVVAPSLAKKKKAQ